MEKEIELAVSSICPFPLTCVVVNGIQVGVSVDNANFSVLILLPHGVNKISHFTVLYIHTQIYFHLPNHKSSFISYKRAPSHSACHQCYKLSLRNCKILIIKLNWMNIFP